MLRAPMLAARLMIRDETDKIAFAVGPHQAPECHCKFEVCGVAERVPMYVREGFAAAIWVGLSALALFGAMSPLLVWWLR
jgi:hypothetical protein